MNSNTLTLTLTHETGRGFFAKEFPQVAAKTVDAAVAEAIVSAMTFGTRMLPPTTVKVSGYKASDVKVNRVKYITQIAHNRMTGSPMDTGFAIEK